MLIGVLCCASAVVPDYFPGTWKANSVKTKLSPGTSDLRKSELMIIDDMGLDQYRVTRTTADGKSSTVGLWFDRRERFSTPDTGVVGVKVSPYHFRNTIKGPKGTPGQRLARLSGRQDADQHAQGNGH